MTIKQIKSTLKAVCENDEYVLRYGSGPGHSKGWWNSPAHDYYRGSLYLGRTLSEALDYCTRRHPDLVADAIDRIAE